MLIPLVAYAGFFQRRCFTISLGRGGAPAIPEKVAERGGGGGGGLRHFCLPKNVESISQTRGRVFSYMTNLSDKQAASKKNKYLGPRGGCLNP